MIRTQLEQGWFARSCHAIDTGRGNFRQPRHGFDARRAPDRRCGRPVDAVAWIDRDDPHGTNLLDLGSEHGQRDALSDDMPR